MAPAPYEVLAGSLSGRAILRPTSSTKGTDSFFASGNVIGPSTFDGSVSYRVEKSGVIKYTKGVGISPIRPGIRSAFRLPVPDTRRARRISNTR